MTNQEETIEAVVCDDAMASDPRLLVMQEVRQLPVPVRVWRRQGMTTVLIRTEIVGAHRMELLRSVLTQAEWNAMSKIGEHRKTVSWSFSWTVPAPVMA